MEDFIKDFYEEETDIIRFDKAIHENVIRLEDDHVNEIGLVLNELDPSIPTLVCRKNPDTLVDEYVILTPKILDFLKSLNADYLDYDLYINYSIRHGKVKDIKDENEEIFFSDACCLTEDEFIKSEQNFIDYKPTEEEINFANNIMNVIKDFHNYKYHNNKKFWK